MNEHQLEQIFNALQDANCPCETSDVLAPLSNDDLRAAYEDFLVQYSQELALGALERSDEFAEISLNANQPSIRFVKTALDVVRREIREMKAMTAAASMTGLLN